MAGWGVDSGRRRAFPADARPRYAPAARPFILRPAQDERTCGYPGGVDGAAGMTRRLAAGMGGGQSSQPPFRQRGAFRWRRSRPPPSFPPPTVIPAKAGIHAPASRYAGIAGVLDSGLRRNDGGGRVLVVWRGRQVGVWIPAFAGMTVRGRE